MGLHLVASCFLEGHLWHLVGSEVFWDFDLNRSSIIWYTSNAFYKLSWLHWKLEAVHICVTGNMWKSPLWSLSTLLLGENWCLVWKDQKDWTSIIWQGLKWEFLNSSKRLHMSNVFQIKMLQNSKPWCKVRNSSVSKRAFEEGLQGFTKNINSFSLFISTCKHYLIDSVRFTQVSINQIKR